MSTTHRSSSGSVRARQAGLPTNTGPHLVITQLAVMGFEPMTKPMKLISVHPGVTVDDVRKNTGFELIIPNTVSTTEPPSINELRLLREEIDPAGIIIR